MSGGPSAFTGLVGLAGAVLVFTASAAIGALVAALTAARERLRGLQRLAIYGAACGALLIGGAVLTRREARTVVLGFALVPFVVGFVIAWVDLRRGRK